MIIEQFNGKRLVCDCCGKQIINRQEKVYLASKDTHICDICTPNYIEWEKFEFERKRYLGIF